MLASSKVMRLTIYLLSAFFLMSCGGSKGVIPKGTTSKKAYMLFGEALKMHNLLEDDKAIELLNKAISKDARYIDAYDLKGNILMNLGRFDEAKATFQTILGINPDHIYALTDLSNIHFQLHEYDDCLRILNQLLPIVGVGDKRADVMQQIDRTLFAKHSYNNPVPFEPVNLGTAINTDHEEYFPGLDIEEQTLYFTRRDASLSIYEQNEDLYISDLKESSGSWSWSASKNIGTPVNTRENEGAFSASPDGKYLFFTSCARQGGFGSCDIWYTIREGDTWTDPQNMDRPINSKQWESQPSISADGITLFFASNRSGGMGGTDIWYSTKVNGQWGRPVNLGPEINTARDEQFPFIHNDGTTLYFTSEGLPGMGKSDIFLTRLINGKWGKPMNLGYPINTGGDEWNFIVNRKGDVAYFSSTGLKPNYGGMDLYSINLYEGARPQKTSYVRGTVTDKFTGKALKTDIELFSLKTGLKVTHTYSDAQNGKFLLNLPANSDYALKAGAPGYAYHSENFSLTESSLNEPYELIIRLEPIKKDVRMVMKNVLFEVDKSELKPESHVELDQLVDYLNRNATLYIEIGGHTDNTGSESRNTTLSQQRAQSVYNYLVSKGIAAERLTFKGYGSSQPVATNETTEGRTQNRRTEIKIVKN
ncbi:MAG: outer membrane protein OmpA-like peptidoglycan-associated protein [Bacteroidia bacterium]|jgi:outer membrane protein OmpA-like peptidoglycan-associated protein